MARQARFITFEGGEGAGKTTQLQRLATWLAANGYDVVVTHEPGGPPGAEALRDVLLSGVVADRGPLTEAFLFAAARAENIGAVVAPALERGVFILCDRFSDSTRVYQAEAGEPVLNALDRFVGAPRPNLTVLLDLPVETGLARAAERRGDAADDRFESDPAEIHERRRRAFLQLAEDEPDRIVVVDASQSEDFVAGEVASLVAERFGVHVAVDASKE